MNALFYDPEVDKVDVLFDIDVYKVNCLSRNNIDVSKDIVLYSKKGTVWDFQNDYRNQIGFVFVSNIRDYKITFKNITFYNFSYDFDKGFMMLFLNSNTDNSYQIIFEDCMFLDIQCLLFFFVHTCYENTQSEPQVFFKNCTFKNVDNVFSVYHNLEVTNIIEGTDCYNIHFKDCSFEGIHFVGTLGNSNVEFENCNFKNLIGLEKYDCIFLHSTSYRNKVKIINSRIGDSNIQINKPLFYLYDTAILIRNTTFENCHSNSEHIMSLKTKHKDLDNLIIEDSEFINVSSLVDGQSNNIIIKDSSFHNIISRSSNPIIINSRYSNISIKDTKFYNIKSLKSELFNEESIYEFSNISFSNISSNSKGLIMVNQRSASFINCKFNNIICNDDSSIIIFNSNNKENSLIINNSEFINCQTNDDFLRIEGTSTSVEISNTKFNTITSFGSIINNISFNTDFLIKNVEIHNNINFNKNKYGIVTCYDNEIVTLKIYNTSFINNESKSYGGSLCLFDVKNLDLLISSTIFENNNAFNGGALYLRNDHLSNPNNNTWKMEMIDSEFINNISQVFGGAIYSDISGKYNLDLKNLYFSKNKAYIGGAFYSNNNVTLALKSNYFNYSDIILYANIAESHGNNIGTKPNRIILTTIKSNQVTLRSGDVYPLKFNLVDDFDNIVFDNSRYYSDIGLYIYNSNEKSKKQDYKIKGNRCIFIDGKCQLNNFSIFTKESMNLTLTIAIESIFDYIKIDYDKLIINIRDCDENQIKIVDKKNNYFYCENPICYEECPVLKNKAVCVKGNIENVNSIKYNQCQCLPGWINDNCLERDLVDIKKKNIIKDFGYYKIQIFLIGMFLSSVGFYFNPFKNYTHCVFNLIFKHSGCLLIYIIFLISVFTGNKLGIYRRDLRRGSLEIFKDSERYTNEDDNNNNEFKNNVSAFSVTESMLKNIDNELNNIDNKKDNLDDNISKSSLETRMTEDENKKQLNRNISYVHSLYSEIIFVSFVGFIIIIFIIILFSRKELDYVKEINNKWRYKCPLEQTN
eukprot:jgi/Orpsp1_1/1185757/evm.model.c7180000095105.1